ncbi:helix-turn-helix transcriptional regulator [Neolewinella aurantiaca]|uniref:Helix-turn-helix transcriptional regulator n=1 Tax=Neolewinella aurantiaca TaxID=2602767 RepID=A0A5C7FN53_9BACT|nr:helix-turn-helix transcriptional regulator [Neolewinella aurantiaca]TXF88914.1 helix-turn-helix transcriptional regulator [Neolewinella aurantiaca]
MKTKEAIKPATQALPNFIASNLKVLRNRKGWSQSELAEKVNLNRGNIASYESGSAEPSICKLLRISNLLQVHPRDITRRDLSDPNELLLAQLAHDERQTEKNERLAQLRHRAIELTELVQSSRKLFEYKKRNLGTPCKETALFAAQYEQLYEVTQQLLEEHRELLGEVGCQCD